MSELAKQRNPLISSLIVGVAWFALALGFLASLVLSLGIVALTIYLVIL